MKKCFDLKFVALMVLVSVASSRVTAAEHDHAAHDHADHGATDAQASESEEEANIRESMAKLAEGDREVAEAQGYCPVMADNRLGAMGTPVKIMVNDQPVFLCCAGCKRKALANPTKTLAVVESLKAKVVEEEITASLAKLSDSDRQLATAQGYCPVMMDSRLGSMGTPIKIAVNGQPVFLCCSGCQKKALANPDKTLAAVESLKAKVAEEAARKAEAEARSTQR